MDWCRSFFAVAIFMTIIRVLRLYFLVFLDLDKRLANHFIFIFIDSMSLVITLLFGWTKKITNNNDRPISRNIHHKLYSSVFCACTRYDIFVTSMKDKRYLVFLDFKVWTDKKNFIFVEKHFYRVLSVLFICDALCRLVQLISLHRN